MGDAIAIGLVLASVFLLSFAGCMAALWITRPRKPGPIDQDLDMQLMRLRGAYRICEQQLNQQFEVSRRRLAEIHQLQAEVRALKFEREAREAIATDEPNHPYVKVPCPCDVLGKRLYCTCAGSTPEELAFTKEADLAGGIPVIPPGGIGRDG